MKPSLYSSSILLAFTQLGYASTTLNTRDSNAVDEWLAASKRTPPSALAACPLSCQESDNSTSGPGRALFPNAARLEACNETMLLDFVVRNEKTTIRACTADYTSTMKAAYEPDDKTAALCPTPNHALLEASLKISHFSADKANDDGFAVQDLLSAGHQVVNHFKSRKPSCVENALAFGYSKSAVVGVFGGAEVHQHGLTTKVLNNLLNYAGANSLSKTTVIQLCQADGRGADYGIGIIASSAKNLALVRETVRSWADGRCVSEVEDDAKDWMTVTLRVPESKPDDNNNATLPTAAVHLEPRSRLVARADCKTTTVEAGDGCWALADKCGISEDDLKKYNSRSKFCDTLVAGESVCCSSGTLPDTIPPGNSDGSCKTIKVVSGDSCASLATKCGLSPQDFTEVNPDSELCSALAVGQPVCCSRGELPDLRPKPNPDGSCATYTTIADDSCSVIAASNGLKVEDIEDFNKNTWGWSGCKHLFTEFKLCVSSGDPPMPAPVSGAICGPTVPGTEQPPKGTNLTTLNPCPLKVCCNIWGQCGTTDDFCTVSESETGAPGTSAPGENGCKCVSNCGRDIIKGDPPSEKIHVAYFEAWNHNRKCLTMDVDQVDTDKYTHIHFAFIDVTPEFAIDPSSVKEQFDMFKEMSGVKKIISFGGWDFSTLPETQNILREAVKPGNRDIFQKNIIAFLEEHNLDGVDLDWEYPGAPDIPGVPEGEPEAGKDYYDFLSNVKSELGDSKTVSFAAPASYHYLKAFPMEELGAVIDYVIYMTYDLHGQWDYGNKWTSPGCPTGNCLRSHVNETETKDALSMITKAGVPSNKVVVGVTSYGRSFKMAEAGCTGPMCKFTGTPRISDAAKGRCTDTGGYISDAEIKEIIENGNVNKQWKEEGSNIMVYNDTEWVAYMDEDTKAARAKFYDSYNFAGTTDWAVDLQDFLDGSGFYDDYPDDYEYDIDSNYYSQCNKVYTTFQMLEDRKGSIPYHCMEKYIVDVEIAVMEGALRKYKNLVDGGYDAKFETYEHYVWEQVPDQIHQFMWKQADKYFSCTQKKYITCCKSCMYATCGVNCDKSANCKSGERQVDVGCQEAISDQLNATFTLNDSDGFWKAILDEYGIQESWVKMDREVSRYTNGCQYANGDVKECLDKHGYWLWNYPIRDTVKVDNPKDLIGNSYPKTKDLLERLKVVSNNAYYDLTQPSDLVDAASMPALAAEAAVANMDKIVDTANDIDKKTREGFILDFISGILFFLPFIGQALIPELAALRSMLSLLAEVGEAGVALYEVVQDPKNAFSAIFGALAGAGVGRGGFKKAADSRRSMDSGQLKSLGPVKDQLDWIDNLRGAVCTL
ncbi:hypothetical protein FQN53_004945 [Emmonsiellopsis sp. PD_33]|nr:hypothetical protein FQN53_004945 [Emmonsiellopsis sp. PD_33]